MSGIPLEGKNRVKTKEPPSSQGAKGDNIWNTGIPVILPNCMTFPACPHVCAPRLCPIHHICILVAAAYSMRCDAVREISFPTTRVLDAACGYQIFLAPSPQSVVITLKSPYILQLNLNINTTFWLRPKLSL